MKKHCRRLSIYAANSIGVVAMFFTLSVQAVTLGHSRVVSLPNQPLRIMVQLKEVTADDISSLSAQLAPLSAWQEAGLKPPVELSSLTTQLKPSSQTNTMHLWVQSPQDASENVLDVLVDIKTATATQRHQVSVLQIKKPTPISLTSGQSPSVTSKEVVTSSSNSKAIAPDQNNQLTVKKGQYLHQIVRKFRSDQYNDQQIMAALVQTNPSAFIQNNMNLLRSGVTLDIPQAEQIAAITPQQARQIYQTHLQHFDEYRQRIAKGQAPVALPTIDKEIQIDQSVQDPSEKDAKDPASLPGPESEPKTDRLELSSEADDTSQTDQAVSTQQELAYTSERLAELESGLGNESEIADTVHVGASAAQQNAQQDSKTPSTSPINKTDITETSKRDAVNSSKYQSWLESNILLIALGLLFLMVILVGLFLRAGHANQLNNAQVDKKSRNNN